MTTVQSVARSCCVFFLVWMTWDSEVFCEHLPRISVRGKYLVDDQGRVRIFHGINSVRKSKPWYDDQILNITRLRYYEKWGFNVIRLGAMWSGVEPEENRINQTYINTLIQIVNQAGEFGQHVILDMHQDVFSSSACDVCYDGIPRWVGEKFRPSLLKYPWPFKDLSSANWAMGYLTYSVNDAFQQFYDNVGGSIDDFVRFWTTIATHFKENKNILGYELFNEPWAGNVYLDPTLFLPSESTRKNLQPMYDRLFKEIDKVDNKTILLYEPVTWGVFLPGNLSGSGFAKLPGGPEFANRAVLSYHYYCWLLQRKHPSEYYPLYLRILCDDIFASQVPPNIIEDIERTGGSAFLTEFGLCEPDGIPDSINTIECNFIMSKSDKYFQSWTYWDSMLFDNRGEPKIHAVEAFARPYARATAGIPKRMHFDNNHKTFEFDYIADDHIQALTEIFIPQIHYPGNISFEGSSNVQWFYNSTSSILFLRHTPSTPPEISVKIKPIN